MPKNQASDLAIQIEQFITRPVPHDLDPELRWRLRSDTRSTALAFLLGAILSLIEPGSSRLTKTRLIDAVTGAINHAISFEDDEQARLREPSRASSEC